MRNCENICYITNTHTQTNIRTHINKLSTHTLKVQ